MENPQVTKNPVSVKITCNCVNERVCGRMRFHLSSRVERVIKCLQIAQISAWMGRTTLLVTESHVPIQEIISHFPPISTGTAWDPLPDARPGDSQRTVHQNSRSVLSTTPSPVRPHSIFSSFPLIPGVQQVATATATTAAGTTMATAQWTKKTTVLVAGHAGGKKSSHLQIFLAVS